ncbi:MAG TPA: GatB/YqeY domain-containing protein [Candidatus Omnitrophota bacterium]|nr:GatB/YqeY domain-containing protein [Candidatus Omnitrophota bacterium]
MRLYETIEQDYKISLKAKDALKVSVLRMIISAVKMVEIQKNIKSVDDSDVLNIIQKQIKQRKDSIDQFTKGNRKDLADKESAELCILETYTPKQMTEEEIQELVRSVAAELGAKTKSETGKVMKAVMEKVRGRADGKAVNQIVTAILD